MASELCLPCFPTIFYESPDNGLSKSMQLTLKTVTSSAFICEQVKETDLFGKLHVLVLVYYYAFSVLLALRLPGLGKRELILVLFVRLLDLRLFGFVCFLYLLVCWKGCGL